MKFVRDPVHGEILVPDDLLPILDHPLMQRLRRIRQLAFAELVYPGATHTRFSHSLGVMHITARANADSALLAYALIHDAGHGPFSHLSETALRRIGYSFDHEERLREIAKTILEDSVFSPKEVLDHPERALVDGGVGSDRLDYLRRDSYFAGIQVGEVAWDRIMRNAAVEKGKLMVAEKVISNVEHVFVARFILGDALYFHKTVLIADEMFTKALEELAEQYSPREITEMDDYQLFAVLDKSSIVWWERIRQRKLFKRVFVGNREEAEEAYEKFVEKLGEDKVLLGHRPTWYKEPKVFLPDGTPIEEVSPLVASLKAAEAKREHWFVAIDQKR